MLLLTHHAQSAGSAKLRVDVQAFRNGDVLRIRYTLHGLGDLKIPAASRSTRADELWRHTCLEAFVRSAKDDGYYEFNFAPSTEWAAYRFDGYRQGMRPADVPAPRIEVRRADGRFELRAEVSGLPEGPWRIGLSAVIEETGGPLSYWALAHPAGKPDFHNADCFALELPETARP